MADQSGDCKSYLQIKSKHILFTKELARIEKKNPEISRLLCKRIKTDTHTQKQSSQPNLLTAILRNYWF